MTHRLADGSDKGGFETWSALAQTLASTPVGVALFDTDLRFRWVSPAFAELSGATTAALLGLRLSEIAPQLALQLEPVLRRALSEVEGGTALEIRPPSQEAARHWTLYARTLRGRSGEVQGVAAVALEATRQHALEQQFLQAQKMEVVGRLAASMAHDFNNLLTAVSAFAQFALEGTPEGSPVRDDLEQIVHAIERGTAVTRRLLAFSRTDSVTAQPVDLNRLFSDLKGLLERVLGEDVRLDLELAPRLWPVDADPGLIEQVVLNLVINARDAMPEGGLLRITTANRELDSSFAAADPAIAPGSFVSFTVSDSGIGMDADTLAHVFEPFFTTKPVGKGTGLGLATVRAIVRQFSGTVIIESEPGAGTTCTVYLPRSAATPPEKMEAHPEERIVCRVLVVEDDDAVRAAIRRVLERAGCTVYEAAHGIQGLALLRELELPPDLVVADLVMPEMGGLEFWQEARTLCPSISVLFMSGYAAEAARIQVLAEEGVAFLEKPFGGAALLAKVSTLLARGRQVR
jgi:two-component system cell cycle sensor histidine kinase/response regulator CckA